MSDDPQHTEVDQATSAVVAKPLASSDKKSWHVFWARESLFLGVAPALGYAVAYAFAIGRGTHLGIPDQFVSIGLSDVLRSLAARSRSPHPSVVSFGDHYSETRRQALPAVSSIYISRDARSRCIGIPPSRSSKLDLVGINFWRDNRYLHDSHNDRSVAFRAENEDQVSRTFSSACRSTE